MSSQAGVRHRSRVKLAIVTAAVAALALGPGAAQGDHEGFLELGHENVATKMTSLFNKQEPALAVVSTSGIGMLAFGHNAGVRGEGQRDGVQGFSTNREGAGVFGLNGAPGFGVRGISTWRGGIGVFGSNDSGGESSFGVKGIGSVGVVGEGRDGVQGEGQNMGVFGGGGRWGVYGIGETGVEAFGTDVGLDAKGEVGVFTQGDYALLTHGKLNFDQSGKVAVPRSGSARKCGFDVTQNSIVIATSQSAQFPGGVVASADPGNGCVTIRASEGVVGFLILDLTPIDTLSRTRGGTGARSIRKAD